MCGLGSSTMEISDSVIDNPKTDPKTRAAEVSKLSAQFGLNDPNPPPGPAGAAGGTVPDLGDQLLKKAGATSLLRQQAKQGRKSSFLSGAMGDVTDPLVTKKSSLGGY